MFTDERRVLPCDGPVSLPPARRTKSNLKVTFVFPDLEGDGPAAARVRPSRHRLNTLLCYLVIAALRFAMGVAAH